MKTNNLNELLIMKLKLTKTKSLACGYVYVCAKTKTIWKGDSSLLTFVKQKKINDLSPIQHISIETI
jgi:hypothetical protein